MRDDRRAFAEAARCFMPPDEGLDLYEAALPPRYALARSRQLLRHVVGVPRRRSRRTQHSTFSLDHHRGSEENQAGWEWHEPGLADPAVNKMDALSHFRRAAHDADLEAVVIALVGQSVTVAQNWGAPLAL